MISLIRNSTQNIWRPPGGHYLKKRPTDIHSISSVTIPRGSSMERNETYRYPYEIGVRSFQPRKDPRKEKEYKRWWSTQKRGLDFKILKVTICQLKACNRVNVKHFNILVNCRVQFFIFPQNLRFFNTFLVFLIIPLRFYLPRSGDLYTITF